MRPLIHPESMCCSRRTSRRCVLSSVLAFFFVHSASLASSPLIPSTSLRHLSSSGIVSLSSRCSRALLSCAPLLSLHPPPPVPRVGGVEACKLPECTGGIRKTHFCSAAVTRDSAVISAPFRRTGLFFLALHHPVLSSLQLSVFTLCVSRLHSRSLITHILSSFFSPLLSPLVRSTLFVSPLIVCPWCRSLPV